MSRDVFLNALTGTIALAAVSALVTDRVRPAIAERARLDPGESLGAPLLLRRIAQNDTLPLSGEDPALLIVFQSTCDVCERVAPVWRTIAKSVGARPLALGLESDSASLAWLRDKVPTAEAVAAVDLSIFLDRFRIRAVPTTLLLADGRLQLIRIGPLQSDDLITIDRVFAAARTGSTAELHNR
ncbi:MAG: hypothetical protein E4H28_06585 [Gemmatimonadales bacterium]|nr:MAG: hypothetical protein E4H28_06585 [Gemmatimonadales bacterium]